MIRYSLTCENEDVFEGWFASMGDYEAQEANGLIECPVCGSSMVRKAPMAPAIARRDRRNKAAEAENIEAIRAHIRNHFDYVGPDFADEARAIHEGDAPDRPIWGEATAAEARALAEDGLPVAPLPPFLSPAPPKKVN